MILSLRKGNYVEQGQFFAWLSRIAHNLVLDHFKTQRGQCSYDEDGQEFADEATSQLACVGREEEMIRMESIEMVQKWITLLPDEQREVVKMRFYQEIPFKEIAEKNGGGHQYLAGKNALCAAQPPQNGNQSGNVEVNATEKRKNITFRALNGKFRRLENNELSDILLKPMEHSTPLPHSPKHETLEFIKRFARLQLIAEPALACGLRIQMVSPQCAGGTC